MTRSSGGGFTDWISDSSVYARLRAYASKLIRSSPKASGKLRPSDLTQDAINTAIEKKGQFRGGDRPSFLSWSSMILLNVFRMRRLRRLNRERRLSTGFGGEQVGREPDPAGLGQLSLSDIHEIIEKLPTTEREIYRLLVEEKLPRSQAAKALGMSVDALDYQKRLLLHRLRRDFGEGKR